MAITVEHLLSDAKLLCSRLRDSDKSTNQLVSRAQAVLKEMDAMRQYQEIVENLNCVARNKPKAELVQVIKEENKQIRSLQQENKELRDTLQELQIGAETIMNK